MSHNITFTSVPENVDRKRLLAGIQMEAEENGDGYPGAVKWHDELAPLGSREEAEAKINQLDRGWYDDHAVRYYWFGDAKETKRMTEIRARIQETRDKMTVYRREHSVTNFKAEFIGCPNCGSKISRKYLRADNCPVCRADMRSETTKKTLAGYEAKIRDLNAQIEQERRKQTSARKVLWLVKYEYHS